MAKKKSLGHVEHSLKADNLGIYDRTQRPFKVVFLGAGSGFIQNLFGDVLNIPGADEGEFYLVDVDEKRLALSEKLCKKINALMGKQWKIRSTTDRLKALPGADYIINCIEVNGLACVRHDNDIPAKYGVNQCIGDTIGPGGLFKAMRTVPVFLDVLRDVEKFCPKALVLNYTNPMSIMCLAAARAVPNVKVVGLCHSVQGTSHQLAWYAGIAYPELHWECAGINHMAWFTKLEHHGQDVYPMLLDKLKKDPELLPKDPIRFDMMKHFGYFLTESSGHLSEYLPYYRKRQDLIDLHCGEDYLGKTSFYADNWPTWRENLDKHRRKQLAGKEPINTARSWEYASYIIEAIETNAPFVIHGNVSNDGGLIDNLPHDGIVEVPCLVNRRGILPTRFGSLPPQCAAICDSNMRMYDLAANACVYRDLRAAAHALMLDPNTFSVCSPGEIQKMFDEMYKAEREYLPGF